MKYSLSCFLLERYNLGKIIKIEKLTEGTVQENYLVKTENGKFICRKYIRRSLNQIKFEVELINFLVKNQFPCPAIIEDNGSKQIQQFEEQYLVLFEYKEGCHINDPSISQKQQIIKCAAKLQKIGLNFKSHFSVERWNYSPEFVLKYAESLLKASFSNEGAMKLKWLVAEITKLNLPNNHPKTICHTDYNPSNILFYNGNLNALIDFDDANITYSTFDLSSLCEIFESNFQYDNWHQYSSDRIPINFENLRMSLKVYQPIYPFNEIERKNLFDVYKLSIMIDSLWFFDRWIGDTFFEKEKINYLNELGSERFYLMVFGDV